MIDILSLAHIIQLSDEWADTQIDVDGTKGCLHAFAALKSQPNCSHVKIILSVGGAGKGSENFVAVSRDPAKRGTFAASARQLVDTYNLDGIDSQLFLPFLEFQISNTEEVDWEHPSNMQEGADYISLLHALRQALPVPRFLLTTALPAGEWALKNINLAHASQFLDLVNLMTYDFTGTWTNKSGHHAQLYTPHEQGGTCCHNGMDYLVQQGVPPGKVLLGIPIYGRSFLGATSHSQAYSGVGGEEGTFEYKNLPRPGTSEQVDEAACAAYCVGADGGFVSYDNPQTVRTKALYAKSRGLGGLFYWEATGDALGERSLVYTGYMGLHG